MKATQCRQCGLPLSTDAVDRECAACREKGESARVRTEGEEGGEASAFPWGFGEYELLEQIGRGGMGVVYRARRIGREEVVALKIPFVGVGLDQATRERFRREVEAARLQHANIVMVHDVGEVDGRPYFTMDLVDGPDLVALGGGRPLAPRQAVGYLRDIASAVAAAHAAGLLHCDLKPSNVLVGSDGRARVADFGLAVGVDPSANAVDGGPGRWLGSPSYASPEQLAPTPSALGPRCDVYGLGAILYYLSTGRAPFVGPSALDTIRLVLGTAPVEPGRLNAALPRELEAIILKCLAKDPAARYGSAMEVIQELDRFLKGQEVRATKF